VTGASGGHGPAGPNPSPEERQEELLATLRVAVDSLSMCVRELDRLIERAATIIAANQSGAGASVPTPGARVPEAVPSGRSSPYTRVSFGGGPGVLGEPDRLSPPPPLEPPRQPSARPGRMTGAAEPGERWRAREALRDFDLSGAPSAPMLADVEAPPPSTQELMAVSELAHLGYSREEIARRIHARWGSRAAAILREALG
jgi:hypothetical protein